MGKVTLYHPVSLHVVRGAAEYCGFKFGKIKQTKSDPTGLSATYHVQVVKIHPACKEANIGFITHMLKACFPNDIKVKEVMWSTKRGISAVLMTYVDTGPNQLPMPEIEPIQK